MRNTIADLIWDLYSLDILEIEDWVKTVMPMTDEGLKTVNADDYLKYRVSDFDIRESIKAIPATQIDDMEKPIRELTRLLNANAAEEAKYQLIIERYPWILGAEYSVVEDHKKLDDQNIPDFTAVRVRDNSRDVLEIKSPFMSVLHRDGEFTSEFNQAWNQAERYLNFARNNKNYLLEKGLIFENPRCYLIASYRLKDEAIIKIRIKQRLNPAIEILTYNNLKRYVKATVQWIKDRKDKE